MVGTFFKEVTWYANKMVREKSNKVIGYTPEGRGC
jgi:hypothetical protein